MPRSLIPFLIAVIAFLLSAAVVDPGYVDSPFLPGSGVTLDEPINIQQSLYLADAMGQHGPLIFTPGVAKEVFGTDNYLSDYPPLGRLVCGLSHQMISGWYPGVEQASVCLPAARMGTSFLFAVCLFFTARVTQNRWGLPTACIASIGLMLFPQFIGHSRLANVDMATAVTWFLAVAAVCRAWLNESPPTTKQACLSGAVWGLVMLTKMQGLLFPPIIILWAFYRFRLHAVRPLIVYGLSGLTVFFMFWPWLWLDPVTHVLQYAASASKRETIYAWYFGERYADKLVPWHYPFVMLAAGTPLFVVPGILKQLFVRQWDRAEVFLLMSSVWPLLVFAAPGVPVYDGIRLFLCVVPGLVIFAARGLTKPSRSVLFDRLMWTVSAFGLIVTLFSGDAFSPFAVNQYSEFVGRGAGAQRLGLEADFWADAMNGEFWKQVPEGSTVYVAPVLHNVQLTGLEAMTPVITQRKIRLEAFRYDSTQQKGLLLLIHRLADLRPSMQTVPEGAVVVAEVRHDSVILARLVDTTNATWVETP